MTNPAGLQIANLRDLNLAALEPLLAEETADWATELNWDHSHAANLVRRLLSARRLGGVGLLAQDEVAGYAYVGLEGNKGLIANVYVRPRWRADDAEAILLRSVFDFLAGVPVVTRIEAQLMLLRSAAARDLERERAVRTFARTLMDVDSGTALPNANVAHQIEGWRDDCIPQAAGIIQTAYAGHVDAEIQERYASLPGAERFLRELVQFPGAPFCAPASYIGFDPKTGSPVGLSLASFVASGVGHIAEICVRPHARRAGIGHELLRKSIETLRGAGARRISLAVTVSNEPAVRLYRRFGFCERRSFHAYVWEKA